MANSAPSSSKRRKLNEKPDRNGIDRLSNLPEHILLHILSFVPTETAISTSVLSKSWQYLWTLVHNLDFDQSRSHPMDTYYKGFWNFVSRVLLLRRERFIGRFRLKCNSYQYDSNVDSWVSSAVAQSVQELDLDLGHFHRFRLHCTQQSFKNLVVLKLRSVVLDEVSLPALKIFHLQVAGETKFEVEYQEIKFMPYRFPVLEELVIVHHFVYLKANFEIYLPKLRSLAIDKCIDEGFVRIDCPALTHLVIEDKDCREYHLGNLLSLVEADIKVQPYQVWYNEDKSYGRYVMDVFKAICNVRILRVSHHTIKEVELDRASFRLDDIPVFHNLVRDELPFIGCAREIIILMLQKFENLECPILWYECARWNDRRWRIGCPNIDKKVLIKQNHVPSCLTSHLTTFCFRGFEGTKYEMEVTRYILENSLVLEYMTVFLSSLLSPSDKGRIIRDIRGSPTASEGCRFDYFEEKDEGARR